MDSASKKRWIVLLAALFATIGAIAYPVDEEGGVVEVQVPRKRPAIAAPTASTPQLEQDISWVASDEDPFAPRAWQPPAPAAPAPVATPLASAPIEVVQPPTPLPYKFVGQMNNGDQRTVYLSRGEQVLLAHQGDVLEGSYKVLAIGQSSIEFESVSSGLKQSLEIPAQEN